MLNINDLHIEEEIMPLFDSTFNFYSGQAVRSMLGSPLGSEAAILARQQLLNGFIANRNVLKDYSFSRFNLTEIHDFLESFAVGSLTGRKLRWKLTFSEKERLQKRGRLILLIRLFYKIQTTYTSKIDRSLFPPAYATELQQINQFFDGFNLAHYEAIFQKKTKLGVGDIVELMKIISEKMTNGQIGAFWERWFVFEACLSISNGIVKHGFVFPSFTNGPFSVEGIYHPFLKNPVKNDINAESNVILLTGPNMSGKSTLLKAISICVYLGHTGLAVPASKASMPYFSTISVAINLTDSIVSGYSHFMSEIVTLKNVVTAASGKEKCFAVFDELFRGTNIEDALEISTATIQGLANFPASLFFISTHLHQLKEIEAVQKDKAATWYIDCELKNDLPVFNYKLKKGWSDMRVGRILFKKEGLYKMLAR
ncbi:MAG: hypothetical protein ABIU63_00510 [Chitinophagaceae bacterium]